MTSFPVAPGTAYQQGSLTQEPSTNGLLRFHSVIPIMSLNDEADLLLNRTDEVLEQEILDVSVVCAGSVWFRTYSLIPIAENDVSRNMSMSIASGLYF